jgi:hypothetical protein
MSLIRDYNGDSNIYGLKGHSTFMSFCKFRSLMKRNLRSSHTNSFSRKLLLSTRPSATKHSPNKSFNISLNFLDSDKSVKIDYSSLRLFKIGPVSLYSLKLVYQNTPSNNNFDDSQVGPIYGYGQNALRSSLLLSGIKGSMRIFSVSLSLRVHRYATAQAPKIDTAGPTYV